MYDVESLDVKFVPEQWQWINPKNVYVCATVPEMQTLAENKLAAFGLQIPSHPLQSLVVVFQHTSFSFPLNKLTCVGIVRLSFAFRDRRDARSISGRSGSFLLQGKLNVLIRTPCPFHPRVTKVARKRPL